MLRRFLVVASIAAAVLVALHPIVVMPWKWGSTVSEYARDSQEPPYSLRALNGDTECFAADVPSQATGAPDETHTHLRGTLTNRSDEYQDYYVVDTVYLDNGTTAGGSAIYKNIAPGQTVDWRVATGEPYSQGNACRAALRNSALP